jgi:hypothetical protein
MIIKRLGAFGLGLFLSASVFALTTKTGGVTWHFHGFAQAGYAQTNSASDYDIPGHGAVDNTMNFGELSLIGLQAEADFAKQWAAIGQLVANGEDRNGHQSFHPEIEWAFLRYKPGTQWQVRAGRFRMPAFSYSATQEVGYTYPWVTLPNEVYRVIPFSNINGMEVLYHQPLGASAWSIDVEPYLGENRSKYDLPINGGVPLTEVAFKENNIIGTNASIGSQAFRFRATYAHAKLTATLSNGTVIVNRQSARFLGFGAHMDYHHVLFDSEIAQRKTPSSIAALTGYYAMLGYRYRQWLPTLTYGHLKTTNSDALAQALREDQESYTLGLDYYINAHLVAKGSVSRITPLKGTFGLFDTNPNRSHVNLYMVSLNAVF